MVGDESVVAEEVVVTVRDMSVEDDDFGIVELDEADAEEDALTMSEDILMVCMIRMDRR